MAASGETARFLTDAWYVAAWSDEVSLGLVERTIVGESILLHRDSTGQAFAMDNTCPHRYAPLHTGSLLDEGVQCPYHGLTFDRAGKCIKNPNGNQLIPGNSDLRVYPLVEKHDMIWIWMGEADAANITKIPDFSCHTDDAMPTVKGVLEIEAYYELITDNLMDLTHAVTVHRGLLGSEAIARGKNQVLQKGTTVWSNSWCEDGLPPPAWGKAFGGYEKAVDHWLNMRWDAPAHMLLDVGVTPTGDSRDDGIWVYGTDILTPIDQQRTRYFWAISRSHDREDPAYSEMWKGAIKKAFEGQDKPIIEAQQRLITQRGGVDIDDFEHAKINTDAGPTRARHVLRKLIEGRGDARIPEPDHESLSSLQKKSKGSRVVSPAV